MQQIRLENKFVDNLKDLETREKEKKFFSTPIKVGLILTVSLFFLLVLFWINVFLLTKGQSLTPKELLTVLVFGAKTTENDVVKDSLSIAPVQRSVWICLSSIFAAIALVISGCLIQSITQNPLADTTTLGFINSTIFGIILMKGVISSTIEASNYHILYFLFALLGGLITLFILSFLFSKPQNQTQHLKIILIGLVLNMIFKTFVFLIKTYNSNAVNASFALAMGGAENIYGLYTSQFSFLKWCALALLVLAALSFIFSQKLNLFELGEEQAKTLGVNVKAFKYFCYTVILLTTTISIVLVGNIAFLGLICSHSVRSLLNTRKYQIIIPVGSVLACVLLLFGTMLNSLFSFISSSIFILFLGGCVLLSLTLKNKDL
ncbi:iron chelate uptake ABC transporter family permease subunit [Candidatus Mycoplasma haematohominis]|uniref:iron chelate uptake ABC transporter family permease subunit n=1 Tax=Candidatus Mycoplasma haematohominis TaxID=1494318 RepID=UPI001FEA67A1|nr:iron chelate uptake ABC transporter family permease subunit [Candidatus Mycoplasma haemohominis]